jgi:hypothetical protein
MESRQPLPNSCLQYCKDKQNDNIFSKTNCGRLVDLPVLVLSSCLLIIFAVVVTGAYN